MFFRNVGNFIGTVGGGLIGGTVKITGKAVGTKWEGTGKWMEEVGEGVHSASKAALNSTGQFIDGTIQGTYGLIKKDEYHKQQGFSDIKDSSVRTVNGIGSTIVYTAKNVGETVKGVSSGNKEQTMNGLKNIGKVGIVTGLAFGVLDIVDGVDGIAEADGLDIKEDVAGESHYDTRNEVLNGYEHPDTGVAFEEKLVILENGDVVEGVFPVFESEYDVILPEELYLRSDDVQFEYANTLLYDEIQGNSNLVKELELSQSEIQSLLYGQTPEGYTWHHNEEPGRLQLVQEEIHGQTGHTGGRSIWGGGTVYR